MNKLTKPGQCSWAHIPGFEKQCPECETKFVAKAPATKFCGKQCKVNACRELKRKYGLKTYGITLDEYDQKLHEQDYRCEICGKEHELDTRTRLSVDHNHITGNVRGLLCARCNYLVGAFENRLAEKVKLYIQKYTAS
jgi:hypothetical protein